MADSGTDRIPGEQIRDIVVHDDGGDLYKSAKILGHSNIKMTEHYAKLAKQHIARTSNTAREMWKLLEPISEKEAVG